MNLQSDFTAYAMREKLNAETKAVTRRFGIRSGESQAAREYRAGFSTAYDAAVEAIAVYIEWSGQRGPSAR